MAQTDDAGEEPRGSHVRPGEADLGEEESDLRRFGGDADVARSRDHRARARHRAVQRPDDRAAALPHRQDQVARQTRELEQALVVAAEQGTDDVFHVAPGAERPSGARDHQGAHARLHVQGPEGVPKLRVHLEGKCVEALGAVERDRGDAGLRVLLV